MRVGALPQFPTNALKYNLTWSTDGLINEYCNPCEAIHQSEHREVLPLEGLEHFSLDGITYEAFNTSGGLGTLCDTLDGRVETLNYKTVRYPGHRDVIKLLVEDLRLGERRHILKDVMETAVPMTKQDVVLIFVTVSGMREGRLTQESYAKKIYNGHIGETSNRPFRFRPPRNLRDGRSDARRQAATQGLRPTGGRLPLRLPRQPLRPRIQIGDGRLGRAPRRIQVYRGSVKPKLQRRSGCWEWGSGTQLRYIVFEQRSKVISLVDGNCQRRALDDFALHVANCGGNIGNAQCSRSYATLDCDTSNQSLEKSKFFQ